MSLLLRKECQSLLDDVGLSNYHVQVDPATKCLQVVGECGQALVSITGIRLSRMAPNIREIKLAVELFDAFVTKHHITFRDFIAVKARADKAKIPMQVKGLKNCFIEHSKYQEYWTLSFDMLTRSNTYVAVQSNGLICIPQLSLSYNDKGYHKTDMQNTLTKVEVNGIEIWLKECQEFNTAIKEKNALLAKISSCEI